MSKRLTKAELDDMKRGAYNKGYRAASGERVNPFLPNEVCYVSWNKGYNDGVKDAKAKRNSKR